ncbi:MAG: diguanylate cyclase [Clostridium sp.]
MYHRDIKRDQSINKAVTSVKILIFILSGIIFVRTSFQIVVYFEALKPLILGFICFSLAIIYLVNISLDRSFFNFLNRTTFEFCEYFVLVIIVSMLIYLSGGIFSNYRFLLILITILVSIEGDAMISYGVSIYNSIFVIGSSFSYYKSFSQVVVNDLPLAIGFIAITVLLRCFVDSEAKSRDRITRDANVDYLTKVYNRRFFNSFLKESIEEADINNRPISVLLIDIDYFKSINDTYGHGFGDEVLEEIAHLIKKHSGENNLVARFGGEEFVIVIKDACTEKAALIGENLRCLVESHHFYYKESDNPIRVTVSVGVCCYPEKASNTRELINRVDDALYKAKFLGRNRVEIYDSILEEIRTDVLNEQPEFYSSLKSIMSAINTKDDYTLGHSQRMVMYADMMSRELNLCEKDNKTLRYAAYLHDIGKIVLPKDILQKGYDYDKNEEVEFMIHPIEGAEIVKGIRQLEWVATAILHHHERYDGLGFPYGLSGEDIPYFARIIAIINEFDRLTSYINGDYKYKLEVAIERIREGKGKSFDPLICEVFIDMIMSNQKVFYSLNKNMLEVREFSS